MSNFKCDKCKCEPEELWMFGGFGVAVDDKKEYCQTCFSSRLEFFGLHKPKEQALDTSEAVENSLVS